MPVNDALGKRMKEYYEQVPKTRLVRRMPVAIRLDGKAFHTFTRGFKKPFDDILINSMQETMKKLCESIQGCVLGYTQSDEITLILQDYKELETAAWFDYEVQKMCSIAASMCTLYFNQIFRTNVNAAFAGKNVDELGDYHKVMCLAKDKGAMFDARCFNIPKEEVCNLIYWRQLDATRNSIQMVGQANFSHKELQGKSCNQIQDMLMLQKGINWNDFPAYKKRGSCCIKVMQTEAAPNNPNIEIQRSKWIIDLNIPKFVNEDRNYIDSRILFD